MSKLVRGDRLPSDLRREVLSSYIYRWTRDNTSRDRAWRGIKGAPTIPLVSDDQWLREHAFYVTDRGTLDKRKKNAEPAYMTDDKSTIKTRHATKKTPADLQRDIDQVLSRGRGGRGSSHATISPETEGSTNPADWPEIFDRLKPGQLVYIAMSSVMGMGRGAEAGTYFPHKVGRRSKPKTPHWWTEAISLEPADGSKAHKLAKYKLWKDKNGKVSMSSGDMGVMMKGLYAP